MNKHQRPEGYVQVTDIKTIQKLILRLMVQFHEICEKHHLIYNLCGGTLLGAVRHKGFIPWDDDMDVCMPRDDYEKFIKIAKSEYKDKFITYAPGDKDYIYPFVKLCMKDTVLYEKGIRDKYKIGVYLDVFPIDGYPGDVVVEQEKVVDRLKKILVLWSYCIAQMTVSVTWWKKFLYPVKVCVLGFFRMIGPERFVKDYVNIASQYKVEDYDEVIYWWGGYKKDKIRKDIFFDRVLCEFEDYKFWAIRNYDNWLSRQYGDYMTPPPPEKRIQYHGFELFVEKEILDKL